MLRVTTAAVLLSVSTIPALAGEPCLVMRNLYSWHELDKHTVILEDIGHKRFKVAYTGYCGNLKFTLGLGVRSKSTSDLACLQRGDTLIAREANTSFQCLVQSVEPYTGPPPAD